MLSNTVLALGALAVVGARAQESTSTSYTTAPTWTATTTPAPTWTTTTSKGPKTTTVSVGAFGFKFTPNNLTAEVGDTVEFLFFPDGHSVIRAEFGYPCYPYELVEHGKEGFYSGQQPVKAIAIADLPRFHVKVNDSQPIFFYCGAPGSCVDHKMIGVINPNKTFTLESQLKAAENVQFQLLPGEPWPTESGLPMPVPPNGTGLPVAPSPSPTPSASSGDHAHLSAGAIAGIAIGGAAVLVLAAALIYLCGRRGGLDRAYRKSGGSYQAPPHQQQPGMGMVEGQYKTTPKSPGTETWSSGYTSIMAPGQAQGHDAYRDQQTSPPGAYGPRSPPVGQHHPGSPGFIGYGGAQQPGTVGPMGSPLMDGTAGGYYNQSHSPPPPSQIPQHPPVELPTSGDPGNSPLPNYQPPRKYSWTGGQESGYRPTKQ